MFGITHTGYIYSVWFAGMKYNFAIIYCKFSNENPWHLKKIQKNKQTKFIYHFVYQGKTNNSSENGWSSKNIIMFKVF